MAGPDVQESLSCHQPSPTLAGWDILDLHGLTLGVYWPWFRHATAEVVSACETLLGSFERHGAAVREIAIPDLEAARVAHSLTIASEMAQALDQAYPSHHRQHGLDVRINLALARAFTALDYIKAQRVRTRLMANFQRTLEQVDAIITPTTGLAAPLIPAAALPDGESDLSTLVEIMRFVTPANLTGLPAISFPAGYTAAGLPVGMQAIGRPWQEPTLLRLALVAERCVTRQKPEISFQILV
jgi:Asp-tRNA(Asn)/Glu-tRNA(Gln) amidotransferase A subunit family amidase